MRFNSIFRYTFSCLAAVLFATFSFAQDIQYSLPQSLQFGTNAAYVLGRNSEGIIVHLSGRNQELVCCYDVSSLNIKWKKEITLAEKSADVEEAYLAGDSILVMYSYSNKGNEVIKANLYSPRMSLLRNAKSIDTLSSLLSDNTNYQFASSTLHTHFMVYNQPNDFNRKKEINFIVVNSQLQTVRSGHIVANKMEVPELINGYVTDNGEAYFVCGDNRSRNYNNAYQFTEVGVFSQSNSNIIYSGTSKEDLLLADPIFRFDQHNNRWVIIGLYADKPGSEAKGTYFLRSNLSDTTVVTKQFMPFTEDFITNVTGQQKKSKGLFDHTSTDLVVRRDGGAIFITEAQTRYSETMATNRYNTFGTGEGLVTNHYYYNELVVFSMDSSGAAQWYQVLRKKQQSDNDGGYYLSYGLLIGPKQLWLVYNDRIAGQNNLSGYSVAGNGDNKRSILIDSDRKNLAPVPSQAKQISPNALVIPSLRKGYFQLIKITFPG